jgi:peptidoglycan-associated lipoprotein
MKMAVGTAGILMLVAVGGIAIHAMRSPGMGALTTPSATAGQEAPARGRVVAPAPVAALAVQDDNVSHADVYFDFKSVRLRADAARILEAQAARLETGGVWAVLVQGYSDRRGPAEYNRLLAQRRAEVVKQFLVELGVSPASVRTVTIGPDGALCDEPSPECRQLDRRVHLEIRRLGQAVSPTTAGARDVFAAPSPSGEGAAAAGGQ